jgi:hypothetical protein
MDGKQVRDGELCAINFKLKSPHQPADLNRGKPAHYIEGQTVLPDRYKETKINGIINLIFYRISNKKLSSQGKYNLTCSHFQLLQNNNFQNI